MTITDIVSLARKKSNTNSNTFPNDDMVLYIKAKLPLFQADIEEINQDYMGSIEYRDLRATGDTGTYTDGGETYLSREYNLPSDMINRLQNVYAKLDGTNWTWLKHYREETLQMPIEEDNILDEFSNELGVAGYFIFRGSLFLLTGEIENDVTDGLKLWDYAYSEEISSIPTSGSADDKDLTYYGIPKTLHEVFAVSLSAEWKSNQDTPIPLTAEEQTYYAMYSTKNRFSQLRDMHRGDELSFPLPADGYDNGFNL
jgi:hypothetical protein